MKKFTPLNNILGWAVFLISTTVYLLTIEPTASFWDCGEFIATAYKLEVMHPPGAPLFMILGRFFSMFTAPGSAAKMINSFSAISSGLTIMFLFWTITHLGKKLLPVDGEENQTNLLAVLGAGFVGAMAYTFSDSFWFSAVEGEVYALSSLFTAVVFWAILKWENVANEPGANRWLLLIAYLMGLSIGVHLLGLLAIPAIVLVYYFKKYPVTIRGLVYATAISMILLGVLLYLIIQGFVKLAGAFEILFVNGFGLPYNSGVLFYILLVAALVIFGIYYTHKHQKVILNTIIIGLTMVIIGFSSYALIIIRSSVNPPMDMNNPESVLDLLPYLGREQYGDRPLLKGQYYNAPIVGSKEGRPNYRKENGKYKQIDRKISYIYDEKLTTIFPRMHSSDPSHVEAYESWVNIKGTKVQIRQRNGETATLIKPSFGTNLAFFMKYQLGFMYFRYFMWNFVGRQNDIQGDGGILIGNWITGITPVDEFRLGPLDKLPAKYKNHPSRNTYYMLPLLLGIAGLLYHYKNNKKDFSVIMLLFILLGIAIVVYLNQKPNEPRERDYAYSGSFYAFSIWIGLGVLSLFEFLRKKVPAMLSVVSVILISTLLVPGVLAKENWDDHDRSGRYTARDIAYNYLNSCAPNSVLFTNGDNDTFPLWYIQEVEGVRTDVRVINLMLFNTEWYIEQMRRQAYDSDPIPMTLPKAKYLDGTNNILYIMDQIKNPVPLKQIIDFVNSDDPRSKLTPQPSVSLDYIPTKQFRIPVDSAKVIRNGVVKPKDAGKIVKQIDFSLGKTTILKNEMMQLDILATTDWGRPIYFVAAGNEGALNLEDYFQWEGMAYRLVPISTPGRNFINYGRIDTDILYDNMMNKFRYGRMNEPDVYLDYYNIRTLSVIKLRNTFTRLADALVLENKVDSARQVLDRCMELMPHEKVPYDIFVPPIAVSYIKAGQQDKALEIVRKHFDVTLEDLLFYYDQSPEARKGMDYDIRLALQNVQHYNEITADMEGAEGLHDEIDDTFTRFYQKYLQERKGPERQ